MNTPEVQALPTKWRAAAKEHAPMFAKCIAEFVNRGEMDAAVGSLCYAVEIACQGLTMALNTPEGGFTPTLEQEERIEEIRRKLALGGGPLEV